MITNTLYVTAIYSMFTAYRKIRCKTRSRLPLPPHPNSYCIVHLPVPRTT